VTATLTHVARYELGGGGTVLVEVEDTTAGVRPAGAKEGVVDAGRRLRDAMSDLRSIISDSVAELSTLDLHEIRLEFGIRFSGEAGILITKAVAEGNMQISVVWKPEARANQLSTQSQQ
jgi:hypothetical protein